MKSVAAVVAGIDAGTDPIQAAIDAVAATIELRGPTRMTERQLPSGTAIQVSIDPVATKVQAMLDAVAAIEMMAMPAGLGGERGQAHGDQGQG